MFHLDEDYDLDAIPVEKKAEESPETLGSIRTLESTVITTLAGMQSDSNQAHTSPATKRNPAETESEGEDDDDKDGENVDDLFLHKAATPSKKRRTK